MNYRINTGTAMSANAQLLEIEHALREYRRNYGQATYFPMVARAIGTQRQEPAALAEIARRMRGISHIEKAAVDAMGVSDFWASTAGGDLARAWLASIEQRSLLDMIGQFAIPLPPDVDRLVVATGGVASVVAEGFPKAVNRLTLLAPSADYVKIATIIVMSDELSRATSGASNRLFQEELEKAVIATSNTAALQQLTITPIPATGTALGDLKAGIAAAADSYHYVVAAARDVVRELAFSAEGRIGPAGGEMYPGIWIVPVDDDADSSGKRMTVIPADRMGMIDQGLIVRNSSEADVEMSDTPSSPGQLTSLWQTNSHAILVERSFRLVSQANAVEVG